MDEVVGVPFTEVEVPVVHKGLGPIVRLDCDELGQAVYITWSELLILESKVLVDIVADSGIPARSHVYKERSAVAGRPGPGLDGLESCEDQRGPRVSDGESPDIIHQDHLVSHPFLWFFGLHDSL